jgi:Flp pilus assembly protein CpaB
MRMAPELEAATSNGAAHRGASPPAAPPARRLTGRVASGHLVMVVAGLVAAVLSFAALRDRPAGVLVAVADRDLRPGDLVVPSAFRSERVDASPGLLDALLTSKQLRAARGDVVVTMVRAGDPVARSALRPVAAPDDRRAMSIPVDASLAVAGRLSPGDRVDVLFAGSDAASIIVGDALVLAVDERSRGGIGETSSPFTVTLAVTAEQSQLLAAAVADGDVSIARTTGAPSSAGTEPLRLDRRAGSR